LMQLCSRHPATTWNTTQQLEGELDFFLVIIFRRYVLTFGELFFRHTGFCLYSLLKVINYC